MRWLQRHNMLLTCSSNLRSRFSINPSLMLQCCSKTLTRTVTDEKIALNSKFRNYLRACTRSRSGHVGCVCEEFAGDRLGEKQTIAKQQQAGFVVRSETVFMQGVVGWVGGGEHSVNQGGAGRGRGACRAPSFSQLMHLAACALRCFYTA